MACYVLWCTCDNNTLASSLLKPPTRWCVCVCMFSGVRAVQTPRPEVLYSPNLNIAFESHLSGPLLMCEQYKRGLVSGATTPRTCWWSLHTATPICDLMAPNRAAIVKAPREDIFTLFLPLVSPPFIILAKIVPLLPSNNKTYLQMRCVQALYELTFLLCMRRRI